MGQILDKAAIKYLCKVLIIALLVVLVIRSFFFEFYTISTSQMESSLIKGDEVVVSKLSYGPRMPITPLSIPFTDSYSDWLQLPYKRFFSENLLRNDIAVFNNPIEKDKPLDRRSLLISRCVAVPGDTILIADGNYYINGKQFIVSPTRMDEYLSMKEGYEQLAETAKKLKIELKDVLSSNDTVYFAINRNDAFILSKNTAKGAFFRKDYIIPEKILFIVPSNNRKVLLTKNNIKLYQPIIQSEMGDKVAFRNDTTYIGEEPVEAYQFKDDYYWMLSDNSIDALDSRVLGFIPYKNIVGRVTKILYNSNKQNSGSSRFFKTVK